MNPACLPAKHLSYGDQRRLEIARALATDPVLLALDEPAAGMNPSETGKIQNLLQKIRNDGVTLLRRGSRPARVTGRRGRGGSGGAGKNPAEGVPADVR